VIITLAATACQDALTIMWGFNLPGPLPSVRGGRLGKALAPHPPDARKSCSPRRTWAAGAGTLPGSRLARWRVIPGRSPSPALT
jgi:hypothetical protein